MRRSRPYRSHHRRHLAYLAEACHVVRHAQRLGTDHIHAHFGTNSTEVAMLTSHLASIPYSFTVHGADEADRGSFLGLDCKVAKAKFVVAISNYTRGQLFRRCQASDWHKVKIIHCGLDEEFVAQDSLPPNSSNTLVCVGRLSEEKGQLLLIEALQGLVKDGVDIRLVLAGDGGLRSEIERRIHECRLTEHVRITGWLSSNEVREELLAARALIVASFQEGLPVVIMEAMVLQRPVITTDVAGIPELVQQGKTGWLVPAGSVSSLQEAMRSCLAASAGSIELMGKAARGRALERHSTSKEVKKLCRLFQAGPISNTIEDWVECAEESLSPKKSIPVCDVE